MEYTQVLLFCVIILNFLEIQSEEFSKDKTKISEFGGFYANRNDIFIKQNPYLHYYKPFQKIFQNEVLNIFDHVLSTETNVSKRCLNDVHQIQIGLRKKQEWAVKLLDTFGKFPAGILDGNIKWLGDYDSCIRINKDYANILQHKEHFKTQYCLAMLQYHTKKISFQFPKISYSVCMPDTCIEEDVKVLLNGYISKMVWKVEDSSIEVTDVTCKSPPKFDTLAYTAIIFLVVYGMLLTTATVYDVITLQRHSAQKTRVRLVSSAGSNADMVHTLMSQDKQLMKEDSTNNRETKKEGTAAKLFRCFSLYSNGKKILKVDQSMKQLSALNGMRFLSISWIVLGHTYYFSVWVLSNLMNAIPVHANRIIFQIILSSTIAVDSFYAMSGILVAFFMLKELKKSNGKLNWFMVYFHRFWRLSPPYLILLFLVVSLTTHLSQGPLWPEVTFEACRRTWWKNILYINNFVSKTSDMCIAWSWYLATDMQFFVISPFLVFLLFRKEIIGIIVLVASALASMVTTGILAYKHGYYAGFPENANENDIEYGDMYALFYIRPYIRISPYFVGLFTGYILYKTDCTCKMKKATLLIYWILALGFGCIAVFGLHHRNGVFGRLSNVENALYLACNRTVWGTVCCWVIFACATGNGGFINTLLSWKPFVLLGRLTFCIYLVHPVLMITYYNGARRPVYFTDLVEVYQFFGFLILSTAGAFVWSLLFETPMMSLEKILFRRDTNQ